MLWVIIIFEKIFNGIVWIIDKFYFNLLPFTLNYIGAPLFVLGILAAIGFIGGNILFLVIFAVLGYYFVKGTLFSPPYSKVAKAQMGNVTNNNYSQVSN
jgi:hypothetical protein